MQSLQGGYGSAQAIPYLDFDVIRASTRSRSSATPTSRPCTSRSARRPGSPRSTATASSASATRRRRIHPRPAARRAERRQRRARSRAIPTTRTCARSRREGDRAARRRLPLAPHADDGHALGARADDAILFFEDVTSAAVLGRRRCSPARPAGKLDAVAGVVVGEMKDCDWGDRPASDWARTVARGRARGAPRAARRSRPLQASARPREALAALPLGVRCTLDAEAEPHGGRARRSRSEATGRVTRGSGRGESCSLGLASSR